MTRWSQKKRELRFVQQLAAHVGDLAGLRLAVAEYDPPDVSAGAEIGIEVTEFLRRRGGAPRVPVEKAREEITRRAQHLYEERGGRRLHVHVYFRDGPLPMHESGTLAEQIARAVFEQTARAAPSGEVHGDQLQAPASACVNWISLHDDGHGGGWECLSGGSVESRWDEVEKLAKKKEADLPRWPASAKHRWLLIVASGTQLMSGQETLLFSSMFPQLDLMPAPTLRSAFDRIYFLDVVTDKVVRLA